ncbi:MAG: energy-coupling factor transporter transmembrane component T [Syntrophomonadaceae bacterium]|nr:energy-coupling factor transporter transmembrane component T [Syntrophomonadaceae bacterium]
MTGIKIGQYVHGDSFLHSLDPRIKIICCIVIMVSVLINYSWYYLLFHLLLIIMAIKASGLSFRFMSGCLRSIRYLLLVTFVLQIFLTPGEAVLSLGRISISQEGLLIASINLLRLLILFFGSLLLIMTTSPIKLSAGIEFLLLPLNKLNIPVHHFTTILSISFRFIPTLIEEATIIKNAQRSRGAQFDSPNLIVRLKSYMAIIIPLFEASLLRAEELGEAMDSRCYTGHPNQLRMSSLKLMGKDLVLLGFMFLVLGIGISISLGSS